MNDAFMVVDSFVSDRLYRRFRHITQKAGGLNIQRDVLKDYGALGSEYTI